MGFNSGFKGLTSDRKNGYFTCKNGYFTCKNGYFTLKTGTLHVKTGTLHVKLCTFMITSRAVILRMRNVSDKQLQRKPKHTPYVQ